MDQNLEPKTSPPPVKMKARRIHPPDKGYYLLGAHANTFVGYIQPRMTDAEAQEYIEMHDRLEPRAVREAKARDRAVLAAAAAEAARAEAEAEAEAARAQAVAEALAARAEAVAEALAKLEGNKENIPPAEGVRRNARAAGRGKFRRALVRLYLILTRRKGRA